MKENPRFIEENIDDLCASLQNTIIDILVDKLKKAIKTTGVKHVAIGGGVSANSGVRDKVAEVCGRLGVKAWIPKRVFTTDNAAMVAMAGYHKFLKKDYSSLSLAPYARVTI